MVKCFCFVCAALLAATATAQVPSPKVLRQGQPDASDLKKLAAGIYANAGARTPRERAEAVWRFFLTDGRFVKPGFWYHIAGWAYEEPMGEVLDPVKLLNSYGFGLCYQIAPVLEAVWKAGGFEDARVWFLTGHTVAEVFYDGAYHHFDSDMMGYNPLGAEPLAAVASVHQIESDGNIILSKMSGPNRVSSRAVSDPWYPADVREGEMKGLAELFTTTSDNWLFPFERSPQAHSMDFVLRPGERLIRYSEPEHGNLYYLPYKNTGAAWKEFPQEIAQYAIRTEDGPHSQRDDRRWATGRIEYRPAVTGQASSVYEVHSPWVIIDAEFRLDALLASAQETLSVETSTDGGRTWQAAADLHGPHRGPWRTEPAVLTRSEHGRRTAVSGTYGYLVRIAKSATVELRDVLMVTRFQQNPRTLPRLVTGRNELVYTATSAPVKREVPVSPASAREVARTVTNARYVEANGQGLWVPGSEGPAEFVFRLAGDGSGALSGFDAGGRFLDLSSGLAPDKFTAEVRKAPQAPAQEPAASIAWSRRPEGPFETVWQYDPRLRWKDGVPIDRTLRWPEVDRHIDVSSNEIYVRYRFQGMAIDSFRLASETAGAPGRSPIEVTHTWKQDGLPKTVSKLIPPGTREYRYTIEIPPRATVTGETLTFECR